MGQLSFKDAINGLKGSVRFFKEYIGRLKLVMSLVMCERYMIVIQLGLYLYCKYYRCGRKNKDKYDITANVLYEIYKDYDIGVAEVANDVVRTRNAAVHGGYLEETDNVVDELLLNANLIRLLRCEGIIDKNGKYIMPVGDNYTPVSSRDIAKELAKASVERINVEDKEYKKLKDNPFKSAANKMNE